MGRVLEPSAEIDELPAKRGEDWTPNAVWQVMQLFRLVAQFLLVYTRKVSVEIVGVEHDAGSLG